MPFQAGDKVHRLTIVKRLDGGQYVVRCECGAEPFFVWASSLRTGRRRACQQCQALEKKYQREIAAAKKAIEAAGGIVHGPSQRPKWEYQGREDLLVAEQERENTSESKPRSEA